MSLTQRTQRQKAKQRLEEQRRIDQMRREKDRHNLFNVQAVPQRRADMDKRKKFFLGLLMLPLCLLALVTFLDLLFTEAVGKAFWKNEGFWFFGCGCLCWWTISWWRRGEPGLMYVFAHEMTHAIAVRLSGGKVHQIKVESGGGFVDTDKTNTWITLSPYLVPFYTVVVLALFGLLSLVIDMDRTWNVAFGFQFKGLWAFYFLVGLTWCFHLMFTMKVLQTEQSDLLHNGEFFSMMLIILINIVILVVLFIAVSPTAEWADVYADLKGMLRWMLRMRG